MHEEVKAFASLYAGADDRYGIYNWINGKNNQHEYDSIRKPLTLDLIDKHLKGEISLATVLINITKANDKNHVNNISSGLFSKLSVLFNLNVKYPNIDTIIIVINNININILLLYLDFIFILIYYIYYNLL